MINKSMIADLNDYYVEIITELNDSKNRSGWASSITFDTKVKANNEEDAIKKGKIEFYKKYPNEKIKKANAYVDTSSILPDMPSLAKGGKISRALNNIDKWMPEDFELQKEYYQLINDKDQKGMEEFLDMYADQDRLMRYGIQYEDLGKLSEAIIGGSKYANGGEIRLDKIIKIDVKPFDKEVKQNAVETLNEFFNQNNLYPQVKLIWWKDAIYIYPENNNQIELIKDMIEDMGYEKYEEISPIEYHLEWRDDENDEYNGSFETLGEALENIKIIKDSGGRIIERAKYYVNADGEGRRIGSFEDGGYMAKGGATSDVITLDIDANFTSDGKIDVKKHVANIGKKFKIKIEPTGKSWNAATVEYTITGKKKDILNFLSDDSYDEDEFGMGYDNEEIEEFFPELFEDGGYMADGGEIKVKDQYKLIDTRFDPFITSGRARVRLDKDDVVKITSLKAKDEPDSVVAQSYMYKVVIPKEDLKNKFEKIMSSDSSGIDGENNTDDSNKINDMKHIAYIEDSRRPGGSDKSIKKTYNLDVEDRSSDGFYVAGSKEDIEDFINDYSINFAEIKEYMAKGGKVYKYVVKKKMFDINDDEISEDIFEWAMENVPEEFEFEEDEEESFRNSNFEDVIDEINSRLEDYELSVDYEEDRIYVNIYKKDNMAEGGMVKLKDQYKLVDQSLSAPLRNGRGLFLLRKGDVVKVTKIDPDNRPGFVVANFEGDAILISKEHLEDKNKFEKTMAKGGDVEDYYEDLRVYVQGVGEIYNGKSMKSAISSAEKYLKKHPKAEVAIVDEKYGDEYDLYGNLKDDEDYAKGGKLPNPSNLYGLMIKDRETGYGTIADGKVYTINEALAKADKLDESNDFNNGLDTFVDILSVEELLKRPTLPKSSKKIIYDNYKEKVELINYLIERFGNDSTDWQKDFAKGGDIDEPDAEMEKLVDEHSKEAKKNRVKITNFGWSQGDDFIVSKTTERKDGSDVLTSEISNGVVTHDWDSYKRGGKLKTNPAKFRDKVKAITKKLTGAKVPKKYKKDYGATYDKKEANTAAKRIAGAKLAEVRAKLAKKKK